MCGINAEATELKISLSQLSPDSKRTCFLKKEEGGGKNVIDAQSHSNTLACQFITLLLSSTHTHTDQNAVQHTNRHPHIHTF